MLLHCAASFLRCAELLLRQGTKGCRPPLPPLTLLLSVPPPALCAPCPYPYAAVERFTPVLLLFAGILIYSSYKLLA